MHKKISLIVLIVVACATAIVLIIPKYSTLVNFDVIEKSFQKNYSDLRILDEYDISMYFGIDKNDLQEQLFMTDFISTDENPGIFEPKTLIIIIRDKEIDYYYDILNGYLDSNKNDLDKDISLYEKAILKKENNYVYLFLGDNNNKMEEELKEIIEK